MRRAPMGAKQCVGYILWYILDVPTDDARVSPVTIRRWSS